MLYTLLYQICSQGLILDAKIKMYVHLMQICFLSLINGNIYMFTKELFYDNFLMIYCQYVQFAYLFLYTYITWGHIDGCGRLVS